MLYKYDDVNQKVLAAETIQWFITGHHYAYTYRQIHPKLSAMQWIKKKIKEVRELKKREPLDRILDRAKELKG